MFTNDINTLTARVDDLEAKLASALTALEAQTAKDVTGIIDGLKSAILPEVQGIRADIAAGVQTLNGTVVAVQGIVNRLDGASLKLTLGPKPEVGETVIAVQG